MRNFLHSKTRYLTQPRDSHGRWRGIGGAIGGKTSSAFASARGHGFYPVASVERTGLSISGGSVGAGYGRKISPNFRGSVTVQLRVNRTKDSKTQKRFNKAIDKRLKNIGNDRLRTALSTAAKGGTIPLGHDTGIVVPSYEKTKQTVKLSSGRNFAQETAKSKHGVPSTITGAKGKAKARPQRRSAIPKKYQPKAGKKQRVAYSGQPVKAAKAPNRTVGSHDMNSRKSINTPTIKKMKQPTTRLRKSAGTYTK